MEEIMIRVENLKKQYKLGQIGAGTLRDALSRRFALMRGKDDPLKKIGDADHAEDDTILALDGVSFAVKRGERLGIIGHNGAGKSTLLKLLSRITAPTEGRIFLNGRVASMLEVGTGFNGELTGRENIYMNGAILGMTKAETEAKMEQIIDFSECSQFIDTPVKRYSSGMRVKLAFSVAAHLDAEIMIMDEVLAVGDVAFQEKCLNKMYRSAEEEHRTVLYVSHNMNTIRTLCDRCIVMSKGRIIFDGDTEEAISKYESTSKALSLSYDHSNTPRKLDNGADDMLHINSVQLLDTDEPIYGTGDRIKLLVDLTAKAALCSVTCRISIHASDKSVVGLSSTAPEINAVAGRNTFEFEFDPSMLAPDRYRGSITLCSVNKYGASKIHDAVPDAFVFKKVQQTGENNNVPWNTKKWGRVMLPPLTFKK